MQLHKLYQQAGHGIAATIIAGLLLLPLPASAAQITVISEAAVPAALSADIQQAAVCTEKFYQERYGLSIMHPIRVIITSSRESYADARVREGGDTRKTAERHAKVAAGNSVGSKHLILLNGNGKMANDQEKRLKTTIHEITHQVQTQLSQGRHTGGYKWLSEGSANSLAFRIMEYAGFSTVDVQRQKWRKALKNSAKLPAVRQVIDSGEWVDLMENKVNCYGLATVMTEFLIDKCGYDKIVEYFRLLSTKPREQAFLQAFGFSHDQFVKEFNEYYQREIPGAPR